MANWKLPDELRKIVEQAPHDPKCPAIKKQHVPGYTHYETDRGDDWCPEYHWRFGPCNCWLSRFWQEVDQLESIRLPIEQELEEKEFPLNEPMEW